MRVGLEAEIAAQAHTRKITQASSKDLAFFDQARREK